MHLVALAIGLGPGLADLVEEVHTLEPLLRSEVDLPCEVVEVADGGGEDLLEARAGVGAAGVDDILGEVGVVLVGGRRGVGVLLGGHCAVVLAGDLFDRRCTWWSRYIKGEVALEG